MFAFFQSWIQTNVAANIHSKYRYNVLALIQVSVLNLMKSFHIEQPERKWCACINLVNFSALIKKIAIKIRKKMFKIKHHIHKHLLNNRCKFVKVWNMKYREKWKKTLSTSHCIVQKAGNNSSAQVGINKKHFYYAITCGWT